MMVRTCSRLIFQTGENSSKDNGGTCPICQTIEFQRGEREQRFEGRVMTEGIDFLARRDNGRTCGE